MMEERFICHLQIVSSNDVNFVCGPVRFAPKRGGSIRGQRRWQVQPGMGGSFRLESAASFIWKTHMYYKIYGPYEIPMQEGRSKKRIDKEDIDKFWRSVDAGLGQACGVYIFSIKKNSNKNSKEKPWYVGKAQNQSFSSECFTYHKIDQYHAALDESKGTPMMYFLARMMRDERRMSSPSKAKTGHAEIDYVEQMFITMGYQKNQSIRNKQGTKKARDLVIEGFYNHKDRRRTAVKKLYGLFVSQ